MAVGIWSIEEYKNLMVQDADPLRGASFGCHLEAGKPPGKRAICVGWLLDQKRRGAPSIPLRLRILTDKGFADYFNGLSAKGLKLYGSIRAMYRANLGKAFPNEDRKAQWLLRHKSAK